MVAFSMWQGATVDEYTVGVEGGGGGERCQVLEVFVSGVIRVQEDKSLSLTPPTEGPAITEGGGE